MVHHPHPSHGRLADHHSASLTFNGECHESLWSRSILMPGEENRKASHFDTPHPQCYHPARPLYPKGQEHFEAHTGPPRPNALERRRPLSGPKRYRPHRLGLATGPMRRHRPRLPRPRRHLLQPPPTRPPHRPGNSGQPLPRRHPLGRPQGNPPRRTRGHHRPRHAAENYPDVFHTWNNNPSRVSFPGGESLRQLQRRAWRAAQHIESAHPPSDLTDTVVAVSHNFAINAIVSRFLGLPLSRFHRIRVDLASFTVLDIGKHYRHLLHFNDRCHLTGLPTGGG